MYAVKAFPIHTCAGDSSVGIWWVNAIPFLPRPLYTSQMEILPGLDGQNLLIGDAAIPGHISDEHGGE